METTRLIQQKQAQHPIERLNTLLEQQRDMIRSSDWRRFERSLDQSQTLVMQCHAANMKEVSESQRQHFVTLHHELNLMLDVHRQQMSQRLRQYQKRRKLKQAYKIV